MWFLVLQLLTDLWKNLVLLSAFRNQLNLDFCRQLIFSQIATSRNSSVASSQSYGAPKDPSWLLLRPIPDESGDTSVCGLLQRVLSSEYAICGRIKIVGFGDRRTWVVISRVVEIIGVMLWCLGRYCNVWVSLDKVWVYFIISSTCNGGFSFPAVKSSFAYPWLHIWGELDLILDLVCALG